MVAFDALIINKPAVSNTNSYPHVTAEHFSDQRVIIWRAYFAKYFVKGDFCTLLYVALVSLFYIYKLLNLQPIAIHIWWRMKHEAFIFIW